MSTVDRPEPQVLPPLVAGQRLDRATFHERYEAMPPGTRAELVGGVVYMPSPLRDDTARPTIDVGYWLGHYRRFTPGLRSGGQRDDDPGRLRRAPARPPAPHPRGAGRAVPRRGRVCHRPPRAGRRGRPIQSSGSTSGRRRRITSGPASWNTSFVGLDPDEVRWFVRRDGRFVEEPPGPDGIYPLGGLSRPLARPRGVLRRGHGSA